LFVLSDLDGFDLLPIIYWQSSGKVKKFSCVLWELEMLREYLILVSLHSISVTRGPRCRCEEGGLYGEGTNVSFWRSNARNMQSLAG